MFKSVWIHLSSLVELQPAVPCVREHSFSERAGVALNEPIRARLSSRGKIVLVIMRVSSAVIRVTGY